MSNVDDGGPAFPVVDTEYNYDIEKRELTTVSNGMALRDYFAAKAMQGAAASDVIYTSYEAAAKDAYAMADAMLRARSKS